MNLKGSKTYENLMRAFSGESQARSRYNIASSAAKKEGFHVVGAIFDYTADQERAHGKLFYQKLKDFAGDNISISGAYPVDLYDDTVKALRAAQHNELEEWDEVYKSFGKVAREEGFAEIAHVFEGVAAVEKTHADRFGRLADEIENGSIFKKEEEIAWMCTVCGNIHVGKAAPKICNVCDHPQGFFMPFSESFAQE
ncbi:rubrerythrin family protein [Heliorestis acidaminivorans]|uniref:Rubrerythrin family protein n=1 Tax=Heliorestis acidaminivorans TaxID=553427 RepID=A0A6I0F417_9FIRM|nr:ferritin family protein [Heliorestis acidaminivorans]KAB2954263.1 rubrerythrin family protein [Heliorestis acidaminivorans]